ncbi:MFS multidrug transporter [Sporothrix schenckii 1099-18]|uniref:MFS multidrug transporter n=1 Tax=Sporothrix schenckii 1099-18 TaxID=1397361 RepID=A0A0F2M204_SPOSC|nr:MFS multidrug transporter [Sporothrix schenckii 1099-18]KJR83119.1 MFS multidrug transporter [Sporothrix schenckii 1099-18]
MPRHSLARAEKRALSVLASAENDGRQLDNDDAMAMAALEDYNRNRSGSDGSDGTVTATEGITAEPLALMDPDHGLVGWDSLDDPANPRNFSAWKKYYIMTMMGIISTLSPLASSMVAPGIAATMAELHESSEIVGSFMVTIYVLGYAIGPLFLGPLSEVYGRYPVVILATWFFNAWLLGGALAPSMPALIVMRLFAGIGGSAVMTIAPAMVADLFPVEKRAFTMSLITMAQSVGPAIGPICGGFIVEYLNWRWTYWLLLIVTGATNAGLTLYMPETYAPRVLQKKAARMRKSSGRADLYPLLNRKTSTRDVLLRSIIRPIKLLTRSAIASLLSFYIATMYGMLYLMFTTIPAVFGDLYGWNVSIAGLAYAPFGIGMILGLALIMATNDRTIAKLTKQNNGVYEPEMRLPHCVYYAACVPISLFWYGWSIQERVHWSCPVISLLFFGIGIIGIFIPVVTYLVDAFTPFAASAVAANRTAMSIMGAFLPLAGAPLYAALDYGVGNTVLAVIALVMTPLPVVFYKYGATTRRRWPVEL